LLKIISVPPACQQHTKRRENCKEERNSPPKQIKSNQLLIYVPHRLHQTPAECFERGSLLLISISEHFLGGDATIRTTTDGAAGRVKCRRSARRVCSPQVIAFLSIWTFDCAGHPK
jgi:hypothetical protein